MSRLVTCTVGFEKSCEQGGYNQAIPYTDRLNYVSPLINNFGYAMAVEKLMGIQVTERCEYIRVIMSEISRVTDHLTCVAASAMELGAMTVFLYMIKGPQFLWELVEDVTGARLTISLRPGWRRQRRSAGGIQRQGAKYFHRKCERSWWRSTKLPDAEPHLCRPHQGRRDYLQV